MSAFAGDMGIAFASKRQLSVTADAAALAGAQAAGRQYPAGQPCTTTVAASLQGVAAAAVIDVYNKQLPMNSDGDPAVQVACDGDNALNVSVWDSATHATIFGRVFGDSELNPGATATAQVSGSPAYSGLRPYAICIDSVDLQNSEEFGETKQTAYYFTPKETEDEVCDTPAGNWGFVDLDEGNNSVGGQDDSILDWTENGYDGAISFPTELDGNPGSGVNAQNIRDALSSLIGQVVLFPVAQEWVETTDAQQPANGANGTFVAPGLVAAEVCGWYMTPKKNDGPVDGCWNGDLIDEAPSDADLLIQWRQVEYSTSYAGAGGPEAGCDLGSDQYCIPAVRLYR
jgi:hypothetical protein